MIPSKGRIRARFVPADERFVGIAGDEYVEILFDDGRWLEGPAYSRDGNGSGSLRASVSSTAVGRSSATSPRDSSLSRAVSTLSPTTRFETCPRGE